MTRYEATRKLLNNKRHMAKIRMNLHEIADQVGVGRRWIYLIRDGKIKNPGSESIDRLFAFLNTQQDEVA